MRIQAITNMCRHLGSRILFKAKKNSPAILMVTAGATGIGCVVAACVATKKLDPILEQHNKTLEETKEIIKNEPEHFTEKQGRRMVRRVYERTALQIAGLYAPAAAFGFATAACAIGGYKIQANRITYLSGALAVAERKLQTLQAKEQAEELERIKDPEERKKFVERVPGNEELMVRWALGDSTFNDPRICGPYANVNIARQKEEYLNSILKIRGTVYYNDMLTFFGKKPVKKIEQGAAAGWIYDPKGGDHQIDIGLRDPRNAAFMIGEDTDGVWLIPNCKSYIFEGDLPNVSDMWDMYNGRQVAV